MSDFHISAAHVKAALDRGERLSLLDVREPWELELARLPGSVNVPLGALAERHDELDRDTDWILVCHHGVRSMHALHLLRHLGFTRLRNLSGGTEAYSDVDPKVPRY